MMIGTYPAIRKILVATDFSDHSKIALARALELSEAFQCSLAVVHCVPDLTFLPSVPEIGMPFADYSETNAELMEKGQKSMQTFLDECLPPGKRIDSRIVVGDAYVSICELVTNEGFDFIVTGRSGHSTWERFILGSTSRGLIGQCQASVLAVGDESTAAPKNILICTDFSETSEKALLEGLAIAERLDCFVHLAHTIDAGDYEEAIIHNKDREVLREEVRDRARTRMDQVISQIDFDPSRIQVHLAWGQAWEDICKMAESHDIDWIIIGNVGRHGLQGMLVGNTADRVLSHSKRTVLAVKP